MTLGNSLKLELKIRFTNIKAQKIYNSIFKMFEIVLASFQIENKLKKAQIFQNTFILADLNIAVILRMPFLFLLMQTFSLLRKNPPIDFKLLSRSYQPSTRASSLKKMNLLKWR